MMFTDLKQYAALQQTNGGYYFDQGIGRLMGPLNNSKAMWRPIPENETQPKITPRSVILHSNAGLNPAKWYNLITYWSNSTVTGEAHFDVDNDGYIGQAMSVFRRADCNYSANRWYSGHDGIYYGAISIETGDNGSATLELTPWNLPQIDSIVSISTALQCQFGTGCNEVVQWDGKGIDYHTKFPYQGIGIPAWTNVKGKTCPGKARKLQMQGIRQLVSDRVVAYIQKCQEFGVPHGIPGL
jgi:hypothetical protein